MTVMTTEQTPEAIRDLLERIAADADVHEAVSECRRIRATPSSSFPGGLPEKEAAFGAAVLRAVQIFVRRHRTACPICGGTERVRGLYGPCQHTWHSLPTDPE